MTSQNSTFQSEPGIWFGYGGDAQMRPAHLLAEVPIFSGLSHESLDALALSSQSRHYPQGQIIWHEGDPGDSLLVVEAGQVRVTRLSEGGQEAVLAVYEAPAALGELALLDGKPRDATVIAQRPVHGRLVARRSLLELLRQEPAAVEGVLRTLADLVRFGNARHADVISLDVQGRLAKWLLTRAAVKGRTTPAGLAVALGRTQTELAAELGTTRSTLNRALHDLEALGLLTIEGEQLVIRKPDQLRALAS